MNAYKNKRTLTGAKIASENTEVSFSNEPQRRNRPYFMIFALLLLCVVAVGQEIQILTMQKKINSLEHVYVYDIEEVLRGVKLDDLNREFEAKINILNEEVTSAQDKIETLKDAKVKDNFADVYLKSLKLKRDTMIQEYSRTLQNITDEINITVTELSEEKKANVVFDKRLITTQTPNVVDLTDDIIKRAKISRPKILDEQ